VRHDGGIALANAGGFNHHHIKASHLASGHHIGQRGRNFAAKIARSQTAHEHALAITPRVDGVHANAVAQQGTAALAARWIDGHHCNAQVITLV